VPNHSQVGVIGSAVIAPSNLQQSSLEETLHTLTLAALKSANLSIEDIDGIVVAGCDQLDGRAISIMAASGSVGGVGRDILSTPSSSEHALVLGALRVKSGMYKTQLVVSWSPLEVDSVNETQRLSNDPYYHRSLPQDDLSSYALQANLLENEVPQLREAVIELTKQLRLKGQKAYPNLSSSPIQDAVIKDSKMLRYPITQGMVCPPCFGAVAMILADENWINEHNISNPAWIQGMGWATETTYLGDRDLSTIGALKAAANQAYKEAGVVNPREAFDLIEVSDPSAYQALLSLEGLGLCDKNEWVKNVNQKSFEADSELPMNLSGGAAYFNPVFCAGLLRMAEAASQVRGLAGVHQQKNVKAALGHGSSGLAMQYNTVVIFGKTPKEISE